MYREAEEQINEGLSPLSRILLGSMAGLFGLMMIFIAPPTDKQVFFYLFGGFCLVIAFACIFKGRVRQFFGSIIGVVLVAASTWYLSSQLMGAVHYLAPGQINPFLMQSCLLCSLVFLG